MRDTKESANKVTKIKGPAEKQHRLSDTT